MYSEKNKPEPRYHVSFSMVFREARRPHSNESGKWLWDAQYHCLYLSASNLTLLPSICLNGDDAEETGTRKLFDECISCSVLSSDWLSPTHRLVRCRICTLCQANYMFRNGYHLWCYSHISTDVSLWTVTVTAHHCPFFYLYSQSFAFPQLQATRAVRGRGRSVPIISCAALGTGVIILFFDPESMGGTGDIGAKNWYRGCSNWAVCGWDWP